MDIVSQLIPPGHYNRIGEKLEALKAIVFHYTANSDPDATAIMNAKYFARKYVTKSDGKLYEMDGRPFVGGSAQIIADKDKVVMAIPPDEAARACGDHFFTKPGQVPDPNDPIHPLGQQPFAKLAFNHRQNYQTVSVEICNNNNWDQACQNAAHWAIDFLKGRQLGVDLDQSLDPQHFHALPSGKVLLVRHFDVSGKPCPKPFVDHPDAWEQFVRKICGML